MKQKAVTNYIITILQSTSTHVIPTYTTKHSFQLLNYNITMCQHGPRVPKTYTAFLLPMCQFSHINPAIVRPLPTPAPSPTKNPALTPLGRCWRCLCQGEKSFNKKADIEP